MSSMRRTIDSHTASWAPEVRRGRRLRRIWQELTRAHMAGERMPTLRDLVDRCDVSCISVAKTDVHILEQRGLVRRLRHAHAIRVLVPYHAQRFD